MIGVVPAALLTLMYFLYRDSPGGTALFSRIALVLLGVLPFALMFIVTSIAMKPTMSASARLSQRLSASADTP
mgnify:CR=1 FL=1